MYFACRGVLWFQAIHRNTAIAGKFTALVYSPEDIKARLIALPIITIVLVALWSCQRRLRKIAGRNKVFVALAMLSIGSAAWSQSPFTSIVSGMFVTTNILFGMYLFTRFTPTRQLQLFMLLGGIVTFLSIITAMIFPNYGLDHRGSSGAWQGIFEHKNTCAVIVTYLMSAGFYAPFLRNWGGAVRACYLVSGGFLVLMTQSRTGWILAIVLLTYVTANRLMRKLDAKAKAISIMIGVIFAGILTATVSSHFSALTYMLGKDPTLTGRTSIFAGVLQSIMKHPFLGYGYAAFWKGLQGESANVSLQSRWILPAVDNGYLSIWLELGGTGLGLFIWSAIRATKDATTCLAVARDPYLAWCGSIVCLALVSNMAERMIMIPNQLSWIMYVTACVALSARARSIRAKRR